MTPFERTDRCCLKCEHKGDMVRARRTIEEAEGKFVEPWSRCRSCSHEWWEHVPAPPETRKPDAA
jgi:hypothetical protein